MPHSYPYVHQTEARGKEAHTASARAATLDSEGLHRPEHDGWHPVGSVARLGEEAPRAPGGILPSSCSQVVSKRFQSAPARKASPRKRPAPHKLTPSSPVIADRVTTEADLCEWANCFARFHTDPRELYIPLALRTVDCLVEVRPKPPAAPIPPRLMRCVREVAKFNSAQGIEWMLIAWVPGLPGMQFQRCASLEEAMTRLDSPPDPIRL